jgi:putative transposase
MPNHIHLVVVPENLKSMHLTIREVHRRYSLYINLKLNWQGSLWQKRYYSFPLEDAHLYRAVRYVENNPVRAGLVNTAESYSWSSANAHVYGKPNILLSSHKLGIQQKDWKAYLRETEEEEEIKEIRARILSGRPLGGDFFITSLEKTLGREIRPKSPGRKKIGVPA